ncbi:restriction endonuclease [Agrobacterium tumefaciens]|uniref:nSTAND3 domain-containing NTPase n=1 Tax=Agrobacterium tumefaciens TaxID=358 RepID=UPI003BA192B3
MPDYDFHQLSAHDLEILTRDLLQAEWKVAIENFKAGKDGGVDLRFAQGPSNVIIQVKHYHKTGFEGLCRDLAKESMKVEKLNPSRYILVTSIPLSPGNKTTIANIFAPGRLLEQDIVGQEGLNNLLGRHPDVEGKHFKLWLASRAVLDRVLHNAAVTKSEFKAKRVYEQAKRYVESSAYGDAMRLLAKKGVVIIAGPPGVGKTTLADLVLYSHLEQGYQAIIVDRDVEEACRVFQPGAPQIFYFDDFMGATYLGENGLATRNDDRVLLDFIGMVRSNSNSRLVLTTREHIYSQAISRSERLRNSEIDDYRVVLQMPAYSLLQRARILYNHLYFSDLPVEYRNELLRNNFYLQIVKHEKFNPRLIEWLSTFRRVKDHGPSQYQAFIARLLADPSEIWRHAYNHQISEASRSFLLTLLSTEGKISSANLQIAFDKLHAHRARRYHFQNGPGDLNRAIRDLNGSFIKPSGADGYEVLDPSVLDLMNTILREETHNAVDVIVGACDFSQIQRVWKLSASTEGKGIIAALAANQTQILEQYELLSMRNRRHQSSRGVSFHGTTFESRLLTTIEMANAMPGGPIEEFLGRLYARVIEEHRQSGPILTDVAEVLRAVDLCKNLPRATLDKISDELTTAALEDAKTSCSGGDLAELVSILDTDGDQDSPIMQGLRAAFKAYENKSFHDEVSDCRSTEEFDRMLEDLDLFQKYVGVNVDGLVRSVKEAQEEWESENYSSRDGDEGHYSRRSDGSYIDQEVVEMFNTLRSES